MTGYSGPIQRFRYIWLQSERPYSIAQTKHIMKCKYLLALDLAEVHQLTGEAPPFMDKSQSKQVLKILLEAFAWWGEEDIPAMYQRVHN